jgi:hypothetical protein
MIGFKYNQLTYLYITVKYERINNTCSNRDLTGDFDDSDGLNEIRLSNDTV